VQRQHDDIERVLIAEGELRARIGELGRQIGHDYELHPPLLVGVLKGAVMFLVDLARTIDLPITLDFMAVSSYGASTQSSGVVRILKDLDHSIEGKHVLLVEDIVDTGLTLRYIVDNLRDRGPASVRICALLQKVKPRDIAVPIDYVGFAIPDEFVVGYGLDYGEIYRNLPYVGVLRPRAYGHG
jgi:hypoxanthine phosphoribosyltransferase